MGVIKCSKLKGPLAVFVSISVFFASNFKALATTVEEALEGARESTEKARQLVRDAEERLNKLPGPDSFKMACLLAVNPVDELLAVTVGCDAVRRSLVELRESADRFAIVFKDDGVTKTLNDLLGCDVRTYTPGGKRPVGLLEKFWLNVLDRLFPLGEAIKAQDPFDEMGYRKEVALQMKKDWEGWREDFGSKNTGALTVAQIFLCRAQEQVIAAVRRAHERTQQYKDLTLEQQAAWWRESQKANEQDVLTKRRHSFFSHTGAETLTGAVANCVKALASITGALTKALPAGFCAGVHLLRTAETAKIILRDIELVLDGGSFHLVGPGGLATTEYWRQPINEDDDTKKRLELMAMIGDTQTELSLLHEPLKRLLGARTTKTSWTPSQQIPESILCMIPFEKIIGYCLDPFHPVGGNKAFEFWRFCGYSRRFAGLFEARLRSLVNHAHFSGHVEGFNDTDKMANPPWLCRARIYRYIDSLDCVAQAVTVCSLWQLPFLRMTPGGAEYDARPELVTCFMQTGREE
jgi:hypothetical protein